MKKYIPDTITLMNLLCGSIACIMSLDGRYYPAFLFIIAAAVFDFFDGFAARALNAYSKLGKELDSLSDLISFGLAPALMLFNWYRFSGVPHPCFAWVALLLPIAAAVRLARFNTDTGQGTDFLGLAVPAAAMVSAPLVAFVHETSVSGCNSVLSEKMFALLCTGWFIPLLAAVLAVLMTSRIPMFSMKHKKLSFRKFPLVSIFICLFVMLLLILQSYDMAGGQTCGFQYFALPLGVSLGFGLYILLNLAASVFGKHKAN